MKRLIMTLLVASCLLSVACGNDVDAPPGMTASDIALCVIGDGSEQAAVLYDPTGHDVVVYDNIYYRESCVEEMMAR